MYLSIIVPCYNEENRIEKTIDVIVRYLVKKRLKTELMLVNDGSHDRTLTLLNSISTRLSQNPFVTIKIISYDINHGKGYAVKRGILEATGKTILICDADLSTPIAEFEKLNRYLKDYELVIGSRKQADSKIIKYQPFMRTFMGKSYSFLSKIILGVNINDFTCGFKLIKNGPAKEIARRMLIDRWGYDSEMLKIAALHKYRIKETGVIWQDSRGSKVRLSKDIIRSFADLMKIIASSFLRKYD